MCRRGGGAPVFGTREAAGAVKGCRWLESNKITSRHRAG